MSLRGVLNQSWLAAVHWFALFLWASSRSSESTGDTKWPSVYSRPAPAKLAGCHTRGTDFRCFPNALCFPQPPQCNTKLSAEHPQADQVLSSSLTPHHHHHTTPSSESPELLVAGLHKCRLVAVNDVGVVGRAVLQPKLNVEPVLARRRDTSCSQPSPIHLLGVQAEWQLHFCCVLSWLGV